jgi:hypothetical protein
MTKMFFGNRFTIRGLRCAVHRDTFKRFSSASRRPDSCGLFNDKGCPDGSQTKAAAKFGR